MFLEGEPEWGPQSKLSARQPASSNAAPTEQPQSPQQGYSDSEEDDYQGESLVEFLNDDVDDTDMHVDENELGLGINEQPLSGLESMTGSHQPAQQSQSQHQRTLRSRTPKSDSMPNQLPTVAVPVPTYPSTSRDPIIIPPGAPRISHLPVPTVANLPLGTIPQLTLPGVSNVPQHSSAVQVQPNVPQTSILRAPVSVASSRRITATERKQQRLIRNREAAKECRKKRKMYVQDLERRLQELTLENDQLRKQVQQLQSRVQHVEAALRSQGRTAVGENGQVPLHDSDETEIDERSGNRSSVCSSNKSAVGDDQSTASSEKKRQRAILAEFLHDSPVADDADK